VEFLSHGNVSKGSLMIVSSLGHRGNIVPEILKQGSASLFGLCPSQV